MPPRKAAPAVEDDQCPSLKLVMEKGPLSGQTNDFRAGSRVQIGRVVRGNTLSIKDAGISTKHLIIQAEPVTGGRRHWIVTDLGSSNGTFLNGERLEPSEPAALSDGDVIIIGEQTSIRVRFEDSAGEAEVTTRNVRRCARRGVSKQVEELGIIDEDSELGLGIKNNLGPGARNEKYVDLESDGGELGAVGEEKATGRRTRGSKAKELKNGSKEEIESVGKVGLRRTRHSKKDEKSENLIICLDDDGEENPDEMAEVEVNQGRNVGTRGTRSARNNEILSNDLNVDVNKNLEPSGVKIMERVSVRRTRSSRKEENIDEPLIDLSVIAGKRTRKGTRGRKNLGLETPLDVKEKEESNLEEQNVCEEEKKISEVGVDERETPGRETATEFASTSGVKEGGVEAGNGDVVVDLEKMTLGGWLEFLEVYLPKQIVDATEEMISEMRQEAERLHEFVLQKKKNATGKGDDVAIDKKIG
ncbi:fha domain-containing protein at4g14490 [Phtheirospermum japonicum]|uniref:Fha domain-containing protein at4g14490 n=1 Tax=Phtheirospermum japonicum TaxID=374723 RepID=A0A830C4W7_9LAMI|nr:fha domain-containing protein at4g14490 [Phtheirospermum japonicum]